MNFNLNQQDVFSKMRMKMKIEVNWNSVYITSSEWFGLGAFLMKKGQLAQPAAAFAPACGVGGRNRKHLEGKGVMISLHLSKPS